MRLSSADSLGWTLKCHHDKFYEKFTRIAQKTNCEYNSDEERRDGELRRKQLGNETKNLNEHAQAT